MTIEKDIHIMFNALCGKNEKHIYKFLSHKFE